MKWPSCRRASRSSGTTTRSAPSAPSSAPTCEEYAFARYVEDWVTKVERVGNVNYPEAARRQGIYGSLKLTVSIYADGRIEAVDDRSLVRLQDSRHRRRSRSSNSPRPSRLSPTTCARKPTSCRSPAPGPSPARTNSSGLTELRHRRRVEFMASLTHPRSGTQSQIC
ncbi:MAG: energy transducer TonB [Chromatiales bacterium]|nr:energy transducer TonB [Chromatiales bacterium]